MAAVSFNADLKIKVIYPILTKSMPGSDRNRLGQTGAFKYEPRPQVETAQAKNTEANYAPGSSNKERFDKLGENIDDLISQAEKIEEAFRKKAGNIALEYNPELSENEALTNAEETLFGFASGRITYAMFEKILDLEERIAKWLSHQSIINDGKINGIA